MVKLSSIAISVAIFFAAGCSSDKQQQNSSKQKTTPTKKLSQIAQFGNLSCKMAFMKSFELTTDDEIDFHMLGKSFFHVPWVEAPTATTARDGLGPLFSANTCINCHPKNGAGISTDKNGKITRALVMRLSIPKENCKNPKMLAINGFVPEPTYGGQLSLNGTDPVAFEGDIDVSYTPVSGTYADGSKYELRNPTYTISKLQYGDLHKDANIAPHMGLALIGLGAIESIDQKDILANEDIEDKDSDGISGKANWIYNHETNATALGRFTWKAAAATVRHQTGNAAHNDMGLSNPLFPAHNCTPKQEKCIEVTKGRFEFDLPEKRMNAIAYYLKTLKIPKPRKGANFAKGEKIFNDLGCVKCHTDSFKTADGITIKPYSDLLLHDMGDELSDGHTMYKAEANEFRTPPLWGVGLYEKVSGEQHLLHDGRARSVAEAILWHGGEAENQKEAFKKLPKQERDNLQEFVNSI